MSAHNSWPKVQRKQEERRPKRHLHIFLYDFLCTLALPTVKCQKSEYRNIYTGMSIYKVYCAAVRYKYLLIELSYGGNLCPTIGEV